MIDLILPKHKSVLTPEKEYQARHKSMDAMRDQLFVGALMGMAEFVHKTGEWGTDVAGKFETAEDLAKVIRNLLALAYDKRWNVAVEMLNWQKEYIAKKIKEKISGESESPAEGTV